MNILGGTIRSSDIIGISGLLSHYAGKSFYYSFNVLTSGGLMPFNSPPVEDINHATKPEQEDLAAFKEQHRQIKQRIDIMLGEAVAILQEELRIQKIQEEHQKFCDATERLNSLIKKSKVKNKDEMIEALGDIYATEKDIKELSI